jgi:glycosyltransferase involved in cell wall biosynthesis
MNKISIIVPVYNSENTLDRCIQSILAQTWKDFELILTDDGSDDSSLAICRRYAENDSRVKVFRQSHAGASAARNTGIRHSSGEYLMFVDADDFIEPEMLERFAATAQDTCADYILSGMVV